MAVARRPVPQRVVAPEPEPVISGNYMIALLAAAAMGFLPFSPLQSIIKPKEPKPSLMGEFKLGSQAEVAVSVITADYPQLTCADDKAYEGVHCAYKDPSTPWPADPTAPLDDTRKTVVQPYRTWPDNQLILIAGLWSDPAIALRLHREPASGVAQKTLSRFVARCKTKVVGRPDKTKLRWSSGQNWIDEGAAWVVHAESCSIDTDD